MASDSFASSSCWFVDGADVATALTALSVNDTDSKIPDVLCVAVIAGGATGIIRWLRHLLSLVMSPERIGPGQYLDSQGFVSVGRW
ncbi:hypothetical protein PG985_001543 [Apiospora marii]|uniref:uncharacterized protein n=1 Tax=Apiospora marii TaxID=335849 RepID=UPI003131B9DE